MNIHQYLSCSRHEPYSVPATVDPRSQPRHVELEVSILDLLLKLIAATSFGMVRIVLQIVRDRQVAFRTVRDLQ